MMADETMWDDDERGPREKVMVEMDGVVRHYYTHVKKSDVESGILIISDKRQKKKMSPLFHSWIDWEKGLVHFPSSSSQKKLSIQKHNELVDYLIQYATPTDALEVRWIPIDEDEEIVVPLTWTSYKLYTVHKHFIS